MELFSSSFNDMRKKYQLRTFFVIQEVVRAFFPLNFILL